MQELFYDGLGNPYLKPEGVSIRNRFSIYGLVYVRDIDRYLFINPIPKIRDDFFKLVGGGIKKGESDLEALNREFLEEIGFPLNDYYNLKEKIEYKVSFKPLRKTEEYWYNNQKFYFFEIEKFKESNYPSVDSWFCENEGIPANLLSKSYIEKNLNNFHFTIRMALKSFLKI